MTSRSVTTLQLNMPVTVRIWHVFAQSKYKEIWYECKYNKTVYGNVKSRPFHEKQWVFHISCVCACLRVRTRVVEGMCMRVCVWVHERGRIIAYLSTMPRTDAVFSVVSLAPPYCSTLSHKRHDYREKKVTEHKISFDFSLQFLFETFLILRRI